MFSFLKRILFGPEKTQKELEIEHQLYIKKNKEKFEYYKTRPEGMCLTDNKYNKYRGRRGFDTGKIFTVQDTCIDPEYKLICVEDIKNVGCNECIARFLPANSNHTDYDVGPCRKNHRKDNKDVIFKKVVFFKTYKELEKFKNKLRRKDYSEFYINSLYFVVDEE